MAVTDTASRSPMPHAQRGVLGARARWGPRRIMRLDQVSPPVRAAIEAMVEAEENARRPHEQAAYERQRRTLDRLAEGREKRERQ